ncbi:LOW QUALITY PROTEIN: vomeronasal type-2 receptor 26-like [Rhinoderma darwinii]|uniref:LOW QUALITY PROTEIN: vomeronasal type-2 receptor 26-like n=1 Tax=Rhinoderma darwinii TaxID=43563 RepID=UPI003F66E843
MEDATFPIWVLMIILIPLNMSTHAEDKSYRMRFSIDNDSPKGYSRDGDIIIGGVLQILLLCYKAAHTFMEAPSVDVCTLPTFQYLQHFLAFVYAIEEINTSKDILPNMSLGFQLYDSCDSESLAIMSTLNILSAGQDLIPNYSCEKTPKIAAFIGHLLSSSTYTIAQITQLYGYPLISYGAMDPVFNDRIQFPSVYRTIPNEYHQFQVILQLLLHFQWTWVGIISTDDYSNNKASEELRQQLRRKGICVEFLAIMSTLKDIEKLIGVLKTSSSNVIILYITSEAFIKILHSGNFKRLPSKVWISSVNLNIITDLEFKLYLSPLNGSLPISVHKKNIDGLQEFSFNAFHNVQYNPFLESFCITHFGFWHILNNDKNQTNNLWVKLLESEGTSTYTFTYTIYNAVHLLAKALHEMYTAKQSTGIGIHKIPQSLCSNTCSKGNRKSLQLGKLPCCFDCVPCSDGEIANLSGMENCIECPEEFWSNINKTVCIRRTIEYLSYSDHLGLLLAGIAITFAVTSTSVMIIFVKHRNTPIVRANNQHLSYVLLIALTLCFMCSLLFIGHPMDLTCLLRHSLFLFVFSVAISSLLGKTVTVIIAFNAAKPGCKLKKWMGSRVSIVLTTICSLGEFLICVTWIICAPPQLWNDSKIAHDKLILQCMDISTFYFYLAISYIGLLALLSFIVAYSARQLPDNFNEAQYITFSMIVFCSVWLSFIPTYLSTKGKYTVAVEIFAILISTAGLLMCIFTPKCYVILLKPELNHKRHINITKKKMRNKNVLPAIVLPFSFSDRK